MHTLMYTHAHTHTHTHKADEVFILLDMFTDPSTC